eukprot:6672729-Alexandrium_andersonii.AAC.1
MVQGQPHGRSARPVREDSFHLALVQGTQRQGIELPCNAEGDDSVPPASEPAGASALVARAGPQGEGPQSPHCGRQRAAHGGPDHRPKG